MTDITTQVGQTLGDPRIGSRLHSRYLVEERLGHGGMATVYRARDELLGRDVAIKVMHPALAYDPELVERFRREATSAARLSHPNIVTVYDCGSDNGALFIVMELVDGTTLRTLLDRFGHFDTQTSRHVARGVASALDHAHAKGIVHRDVKPENILLTPTGDVKVVDFGIAKAIGTGAVQLTSDRGMGTVAYVAPEQISRANVDGRADVYALGAITYEMVTGRPPFSGDTAQAVAASRMHSPVLSPGVNPAIDGAVARATARSPEARFETAGEFARALGDGGAGPTYLNATDRLPAEPEPDHSTTAIYTPPVAAPESAAESTSVLPLSTRLRRRRRIRSRILTVVALLLACAAIAAYASLPKVKTIPNLRGQTLDAARAQLERAGLKLGTTTEVFHDVIPKGEIVDTIPPPDSKVKPDTIVTISVSKGEQLFAVPNILGKPVDEARGLLNSAGFSLVISDQEFSDSVKEGAVVSRDPIVVSAKRGTSFSVVVSKGPQFIAIPNLAGHTPDGAKAALEGAGFVYAESSDYSETVEEGRVIRTNPSVKAPKGSTVTVVVSKGPKPFPVPNFVGMTIKAAKKKAASVGLIVRNTYAVPGSGKPKGQVQGQNPPEGTPVRKGTSIDFYYAV
jgi:serine/threonine protein kinase